jgi:uroporphyrinogen III methyltransferase/synthase
MMDRRPRPLAGVRALVTRPGPRAEPLSHLLEAAGAHVARLPTIEIREPVDWGPVDDAISVLDAYTLLIFTSVNAVERFLERLDRRGSGVDALAGRTVVAIGPATANALRGRGVAVAAVPDESRAEGALAEARRLLAGRAGAGPARVLLPRALEGRDLLPEGLRADGAQVDVVPVYRTVLPDGGAERTRALLAQGVDLITFTSSSTVRNFVRLLGGEDLTRWVGGAAIGCIGPVTAATAREAGLRVDLQPAESTLAALVQAAEEFFGRRTRG